MDADELWAVWEGPNKSDERVLRMVTSSSNQAWELHGYIVASLALAPDTDHVSVEWITNAQLREYNHNDKHDMPIAVDDYTPAELIPILGLTVQDEK